MTKTELQLPSALISGDSERNTRLLLGYSLAVQAHKGQTRKDDTTPYIRHPERVAAYVVNYGGTEPEVVVALWHNVAEDCGGKWHSKMRACLDQMGFPHNTKKRVIEMVRSLTKDHTLKFREEKILDAQDRCQSAGTEFIKLCDRLDNIRDSGTMSDEFVARYLKETEDMLTAFRISTPIRNPNSVYNDVKKEVVRIRKLRGLPSAA